MNEMSMNHAKGWHVPAAELARYAALEIQDGVTRASIEAHMVVCADCRLAVRCPTELGLDVNAGWSRVADRIDQPSRSRRVGRHHGRLGIWSAAFASPPLIGVTVALGSVLVVLTSVAALLGDRGAIRILMSLAPICPAVAATFAYSHRADPAGCIADATPLAGGRLPFIRALASSVFTLIAGLFASLFTPLTAGHSLVWVLPGLALAAATLAAATWVPPWHAAMSLSVAWAVILFGSAPAGRSLWTIDDLVTNRPEAQVTCLVMLAGGTAIAFVRRHALPNWRTA